MSTNGFFKLINTIIEINTKQMCSKAEGDRGRIDKSKNDRDLPNVRNKENTLKLNTVSEISETLIIELTFASLKSR